MGTNQVIFLDYDETYTANKLMWDKVVELWKENGISVVCCTNRFGNAHYDADVIADMERIDVPIVWAAHHSDKWAAMEAAGYIPENGIWVDDRPMYIWLNRSVDTLP